MAHVPRHHGRLHRVWCGSQASAHRVIMTAPGLYLWQDAGAPKQKSRSPWRVQMPEMEKEPIPGCHSRGRRTACIWRLMSVQCSFPLCAPRLVTISSRRHNVSPHRHRVVPLEPPAGLGWVFRAGGLAFIGFPGMTLPPSETCWDAHGRERITRFRQLGPMKGTLDPRSFTIGPPLCVFANFSSIGIQSAHRRARPDSAGARQIRHSAMLAGTMAN